MSSGLLGISSGLRVLAGDGLVAGPQLPSAGVLLAGVLLAGLLLAGLLLAGLASVLFGERLAAAGFGAVFAAADLGVRAAGFAAAGVCF